MYGMVGKLKTRVSKQKKFFSCFVPNFIKQMFADPGLKPCQYPWPTDQQSVEVSTSALFWTAGEQNVQAGFRDGLAFAGLVLTMNVVITVRSDDNVTTTVSCSSRHLNCILSSNQYLLEQCNKVYNMATTSLFYR